MPTVEDYVSILTTPTEVHTNEIIRGGNTTQSFIVPFDSSKINFLTINYTQDGKILMRKLLSDVSVSGSSEGTFSTISCTVNEWESLRFDTKDEVLVQVKVNIYDSTVPSNIPEITEVYRYIVIDSLDDSLVSYNADEVNNIEVINEGSNIIALELEDAICNNAIRCKFCLDSYWGDTVNTAVFKSEYTDEVVSATIVDNICYVPEEVASQPGKIYIGVNGYEGSELNLYSSWSNSIDVNKGLK